MKWKEEKEEEEEEAEKKSPLDLENRTFLPPGQLTSDISPNINAARPFLSSINEN